MINLDQIYDLKKELINNDKLNNIIKENQNFNNIKLNPDNSIYIECNSEKDNIIEIIDNCIGKIINNPLYINMIYNVLPIGNNSYIIKI